MNWLVNWWRAILGIGGQDWSPVPAVAAVIAVVLVALGAIIPYALQTVNATSVASLALMVSLATLLAGGGLGFVFGIPRALQETSTTQVRLGYRGNTNLEQISDWLTKIIIGVGLVQIREIPPLVQRLIAFLAPALGGQTSSEVLALALIVYFSVAGFLIGYVTTRLLLGQAFGRADEIPGPEVPALAAKSPRS